MAELGVRAEELPARHDAAADTGAESEREHVIRAPAGAELELGVGGAAGVVLHLDREPEPFLHLVGEAHVANWDVDRAERQPVRVVDPGRDAKSESRYPLLRQVAND